MIGFDWREVLPKRIEPNVREEVERVLARVELEAERAADKTGAALQALGTDSDFEARLWVVFHALGGRAPIVCGSRLGLVLYAATRGDRDSRALAARTVARGQALLLASRRRPTAVVTDTFCAVRLPNGRCLTANIADAAVALPALAALRAVASLEDR